MFECCLWYSSISWKCSKSCLASPRCLHVSGWWRGVGGVRRWTILLTSRSCVRGRSREFVRGGPWLHVISRWLRVISRWLLHVMSRGLHVIAGWLHLLCIHRLHRHYSLLVDRWAKPGTSWLIDIGHNDCGGGLASHHSLTSRVDNNMCRLAVHNNTCSPIMVVNLVVVVVLSAHANKENTPGDAPDPANEK